jgi:hypothetical protein
LTQVTCRLTLQTMGVSTVTQLPKSQPDISKLNTFTGYIVTVTRHLGPRGTVGTGIISSKTMSKEAVLALQDQLPSLPGAGPGYYNFTVSDAGGTGDDSWLVKLGPDVPQQQEIYMAGGSNGTTPSNGFSGAPTQPLGDGVIHLGHNFFYNEALGTLSTPWRTIVSWKQGDPMPQPPASAASPAIPSPSQWGQQPQLGGWGGYPVESSSSKEVEALKAVIAEQKRERELSEMRAEQRRQQDDTNKRIDAQAEQMRQMFEKLTDAFTKKPSGPSDEMRALLAQNEKLERQMENDRRDAQAREVAAQTREEMRRMKEDTDRMIASITANKSDPMLTMMMQMMSQSNTSAMEAVKAIQASTSTANTSAERQVASLVEQMRGTIISPLQMMEMMRSSRGDGAEMSKMVLETTKEMNVLQRNVFEQLLDASSGGSQPAWLQAVQALAEKVGPIGEALANRAAQPKVVERIVRVPVPMPTQMAGAPQQAQPQVAAAPEVPVSRLPPPIVTPTAVAPLGQRPEPIVTPVGPAEVAGETNGKPKKGRKPKGALTITQLRDMDADEVAEAVNAFPDEVFFGPTLLLHINELRRHVAAGMTAEMAADALLKSRPQLQAITPIPGAIELFMAEQIEVLIERVLPDVDDDYREKVVEIIEAQIDAEAQGEGE